MTPEELHTRVGEKLDPRNFTGMSGKMAALVEYIVKDVPYNTTPAIIGLVVTSDGWVLARTDQDPFADTIIGDLGEFTDNWDRLIVTAELDLDEEIAVRGWLEALVRYPDRQPVEALREAGRLARVRRMEAYRASPEAAAKRAQRITDGLCVVDDGYCVTHATVADFGHYLQENPDASTD